MDEGASIAAAQGGDRNAFNELVVHYQALAYNVAYRVLSRSTVPVVAVRHPEREWELD